MVQELRRCPRHKVRSYLMCCVITPISAGTPGTTRPHVERSSNRCLKCGTAKKSGDRSCCARGGAWFKRCGDAGNEQFDHTWAEGIQACKDALTSTSAESSLKGMRHVGGLVYPQNTAQSRNTTQQQIQSIYHPVFMSKAGTTYTDDCVGLINVAVCIHVLFIIW